MSVELGIELEEIKLALEGFEGVNRRFSLIRNYRGIKIFDDYGHHPIESMSNRNCWFLFLGRMHKLLQNMHQFG